jgi:uncharacterized protein (TIGR00255 family)
MIRSMTGFGSAEGEVGGRKLAIEVKAVNHRFFNFFSKLPPNLQTFESRIQTQVKSTMTRGQVSVFANWDRSNSNGASVRVNMEAAKEVATLLEEMKQELNLAGEVDISHVLSFSAVTGGGENRIEGDEAWKALSEIFERALAGMESFRVREGADLERDLFERLEQFTSLMEQIGLRRSDVVTEYRARLEKRIDELCSEIVSPEAIAERVAVEVAVFADRCDIAEEMVRLKSHIDKFREILSTEEVVGRKIDFLIQEMNREVNTIGSKTPDADSSGIVVEMKSELEKIREQIQNVE